MNLIMRFLILGKTSSRKSYLADLLAEKSGNRFVVAGEYLIQNDDVINVWNEAARSMRLWYFDFIIFSCRETCREYLETHTGYSDDDIQKRCSIIQSGDVFYVLCTIPAQRSQIFQLRLFDDYGTLNFETDCNELRSAIYPGSYTKSAR